jgi:hypothetical protein
MDEQVLSAKRHDPFNDERWSFPRAAAWVIWRSKERVGQYATEAYGRLGRLLRAPSHRRKDHAVAEESVGRQGGNPGLAPAWRRH